MGVTIIIPVYNEEKIVARNSLEILKAVENQGFKNCEILLCDNGSTDGTPEVSKRVSRLESRINYLRTSKKGIGYAFELGLRNAKHNICIFYDMDDPYEKSFIARSIRLLATEKADLIIGSKGHPQSASKRPLSREVFSRLYNLAINALFLTGIADTQGSYTFDLKKARQLFDSVESRDAFFKTEFTIKAVASGLKIEEIPVTVQDSRRDSKISPFVDGFNLLQQLLALRLKRAS